MSFRKSKSDKAGKQIARLWGDIPVVDAKSGLRVFISKEDQNGAVRKNPNECVFARACKRTMGCSKVMFYKRRAYVELPDESGKLRIERFMLPKKMSDLIKRFDSGQGVIPKAGFVMLAPSDSQTFESERKRRAKKLAFQSKVGVKPTNKKNGKVATPRPRDMSVRSGTGHVHFGS